MEIQEIKDNVLEWIDGDKENKSAFVVLVQNNGEETEAGFVLVGNKNQTKGVLKDIIKEATGKSEQIQRLLLEITLESFIELICEKKED